MERKFYVAKKDCYDALSYDTLVKACAAAGNSDGVESFKAGDITVKKSADSSLKFAASVRDGALAELIPLLSDNGFFCCGVEI